jgi:hypothetical protein
VTKRWNDHRNRNLWNVSAKNIILFSPGPFLPGLAYPLGPPFSQTTPPSAFAKRGKKSPFPPHLRRHAAGRGTLPSPRLSPHIGRRTSLPPSPPAEAAAAFEATKLLCSIYAVSLRPSLSRRTAAPSLRQMQRGPGAPSWHMHDAGGGRRALR